MLTRGVERRQRRLPEIRGPCASLTFRADVPIGPERLVDLPIDFLPTIIYGKQVDE
jgi:hypothetical protein